MKEEQHRAVKGAAVAESLFIALRLPTIATAPQADADCERAADLGFRGRIGPTSYMPALNGSRRERATFFTESTANGKIL
jgi:hypothetical protein